jgi:PHP family Zn ribbon phosphoesterase
MLRCYRADLHVHTCLSPCADLTMSPKRVVKAALAKKLDMIAICDHNSAENLRAASSAARDTNLTVLAGMEITSSEEVHVIGLFEDVDIALVMQQLVYQHLAPGENKEELFGEQIIVNEFDEVEGYNRRLLIGATSLSISEIVQEIHQLGGLAIASHVDRETYSIIGQLGFIPDDLELDALEISSSITHADAATKTPEIENFPVISSSDAHNLDEIGKAIARFKIGAPTIEELDKAFKDKEGRSVILGA